MTAERLQRGGGRGIFVAVAPFEYFTHAYCREGVILECCVVHLERFVPQTIVVERIILICLLYPLLQVEVAEQLFRTTCELGHDTRHRFGRGDGGTHAVATELALRCQ